MLHQVFVVFCYLLPFLYAQTAKTPPMGWNSWNHYRCAGLNETVVKSTASAFISKGLSKVGYQYINLDDCWQINRTKDGVIEWDTSKFPNGIPSLASYIHGLGLKFGLYTDRGTATCQGRPGSYGYEQLDAQTYASWGVDFVKNDDCNIPSGGDANTDYGKMEKGIQSTGRAMVHSVKGSEPIGEADTVSNMRRTGHDIGDNWSSMISLVEQNNANAKYAHSGFWNDIDMLEVGNGGMSMTEYTSHFSLWCICKAPLILGNDVIDMSTDYTTLVSNTEAIAINQDSKGVQATKVATSYPEQLVAVACSSSKSTQKWTLDTSAGTITNQGNKNCLDIPACNTGNIQPQTEECHPKDTTQCQQSKNQLWNFTSAGQIVSLMDGKCLDVYNNTGPVVQTYACKSTTGNYDNQKWTYNSSTGMFESAVTAKCLDVNSSTSEPLEVWAGPLANGDIAVILLNQVSTTEERMTATWTDIGLSSTRSASVRDIWQHKDMGNFTGSYSATVEAHGVVFLRITPH